MSRALLIVLAVYTVGYLVCMIITPPLIIWAIHEDEREERGYTEPDTLGLFGRALLASVLLSFVWFLVVPLYILMLAEKITGRGKDD